LPSAGTGHRRLRCHSGTSGTKARNKQRTPQSCSEKKRHEASPVCALVACCSGCTPCLALSAGVCVMDKGTRRVAGMMALMIAVASLVADGGGDGAVEDSDGHGH
jgi:hypothetical protein